MSRYLHLIITVLHEMGMQQMMSSVQYCRPDAKLHEGKDPGEPADCTCASVAAVLASVTAHQIHHVVKALARLGDVRVKCQGEARSVKTAPAMEKGRGAPSKQGCLLKDRLGPLKVA